jgi:CheY-like chemotaxis protein
MDEGEGIPKEKQKLIFNRFRQADEKTAQKFGGAGLGLAISKSIVEKMGGKIWVKSQVSKGSTFYFTIPYYNVKEHEEDQNKKIGPSKNEDWSKHTIMIVEDDTVSQEYLKELLYDTGTNLLYADSGQQCFDLLKKEENKPSLILMDLQLPDISGLEITKKIRTENQEIPIIAQTAFAMEEDKIQAMESGCNDFISKPIDQEKFLGLIKKYLMKA